MGLIWVGVLDCLVVVNSVVTCTLMCIETWFAVFVFVVWVASVGRCVLGDLVLLFVDCCCLESVCVDMVVLVSCIICDLGARF